MALNDFRAWIDLDARGGVSGSVAMEITTDNQLRLEFRDDAEGSGWSELLSLDDACALWEALDVATTKMLHAEARS